MTSQRFASPVFEGEYRLNSCFFSWNADSELIHPKIHFGIAPTSSEKRTALPQPPDDLHHFKRMEMTTRRADTGLRTTWRDKTTRGWKD